MPPRIPRACRKAGCAKTTIARNGYCDEHSNTGWETHQRGKSRHERGYGNDWDKRRLRILTRDKYICQDCLKLRKIAVVSSTVDHIIPKAHGGTDDDSNLQSLCWPCHRGKTAKERLKQQKS